MTAETVLKLCDASVNLVLLMFLSGIIALKLKRKLLAYYVCVAVEIIYNSRRASNVFTRAMFLVGHFLFVYPLGPACYGLMWLVAPKNFERYVSRLRLRTTKRVRA